MGSTRGSDHEKNLPVGKKHRSDTDIRKIDVMGVRVRDILGLFQTPYPQKREIQMGSLNPRSPWKTGEKGWKKGEKGETDIRKIDDIRGLETCWDYFRPPYLRKQETQMGSLEPQSPMKNGWKTWFLQSFRCLVARGHAVLKQHHISYRESVECWCLRSPRYK